MKAYSKCSDTFGNQKERANASPTAAAEVDAEESKFRAPHPAGASDSRLTGPRQVQGQDVSKSESNPMARTCRSYGHQSGPAQGTIHQSMPQCHSDEQPQDQQDIRVSHSHPLLVWKPGKTSNLTRDWPDIDGYVTSERRPRRRKSKFLIHAPKTCLKAGKLLNKSERQADLSSQAARPIKETPRHEEVRIPQPCIRASQKAGTLPQQLV